jgi:hypothetical protein
VTFAHTPTVNLETTRCYSCGRWWAKENMPGRCPYCADGADDERYAELETARRTIAALRGALTKAKRRSP